MATTTSLEIPATIEQTVGLFARILTHDVHQVTVNLSDKKITVRWTPYSADDQFDVEEGEQLEVRERLDHVRIQELGARGLGDFDPAAIGMAANLLQSLSSSRLFAVGWVCTDPETVFEWLGLPLHMAGGTLLGLPVLTCEGLSPHTLLLLGAKFHGAQLRSVVTVRSVRMDQRTAEKGA